MFTFSQFKIKHTSTIHKKLFSYLKKWTKFHAPNQYTLKAMAIHKSSLFLAETKDFIKKTYMATYPTSPRTDIALYFKKLAKPQ